jgi:hypothetical protein
VGDARLALEALAGSLPDHARPSERAAEVEQVRTWCAGPALSRLRGQARCLAPKRAE